MSIDDEWGEYKTPCPNDGGVVEYFYFGQDCRGNAPSGGIRCKGCGREFTGAEWEIIARDEMQERRLKHALLQCGFAVRDLRRKMEESPDELNNLEKLLFKREEPPLGDFFNKSLHELLLAYAKVYEGVKENSATASV